MPEPRRVASRSLPLSVALQVATLAALLPAGVRAQADPAGPALWVGGAAGTTGIGPEAGLHLSDRWGVRLALGWFPYDYEFDEDDFTGTVDPPARIVRATLDLFPFGGAFHLSGGIHRYSGGLTARASPRGPVEVNDRDYAPEDLGDASGKVWGRETAPYLGIGWQASRGLIRPYVDLGVAFTGSPRITVVVTGPLKDEPTFLADLAAEIRDAEAEIRGLRYMPQLAVGLRVRMGG